ncbi:MAG: tRNA preQ1(34) S-adenosylmethionine ribosyltransferase-isomerase QueA [Acholeplasmataceae bacterium]|nr:MAG: tRNA preQ1(34) S-adenosylmethionine ribosyltransferase-isomerase QueA [Acholeplasmataceae bacterium]
MNVSDFDFHLPKKLIAQHPSDKRDHAKLLVLDRLTQAIDHRHFYDITTEFDKGDVLVINDTKVIPARLYGLKDGTGAVIEVLLLKAIEKDIWEALVKPARRVKEGTVIRMDDQLRMTCMTVFEAGIRHFRLDYDGLLIERLEQLGTMPLPPYITATLKDPARYQTVYAKEAGSAAAPTAGLHFTPDLLDRLKAKGVDIIAITLHVGLGTFKPVTATRVEDHHMHEETYTLSKEAAARLDAAVAEKRRITCVGTTTVRTLESNHDKTFQPGTFETGIFIYPGYRFKVTDRLITNFHLPKSTLIMLVSAFAGTAFVKTAYQEAISHAYRFFSFGDAMFIK